jgi:hypothetical protein
MPLLIGAGRVREEGSGRTVTATWRKRPDGFLGELSERQQDRLRAEDGQRHLIRVLPGLAASMTAHEMTVVSRIFGNAIHRNREEQRELAQRAGGAR